MIREHPQDPKTLFFAWGPRRASINGACGINPNHTHTLATRSHSCLPSHLPPKNAIPLPLGFCAVQMAGALSCSASRFPISARAHIPPPLCALLQPLGERPHFGIDRPTRDKIFLWSTHPLMMDLSDRYPPILIFGHLSRIECP